MLEFSPKQQRAFTNSNARINLYTGSVRSGKTYISIFAWLDYLTTKAPPGDLMMSGKTVHALRRNVIGPMKDLVGEDLTYNIGLGEVYVFDRTIHIIGANDERSSDKIRGMTVAGAMGDEVTTWPKSFFMMMLSRMSVAGARFFGTTNPDAPGHWLKQDFIDKADELGMYVEEFRLDDNQSLDPAFVESLKREYTGVWRKRFVDGLWVVAEGAIHDMFDEDIHTLVRPPRAAKSYLVGVDYGTGNPTAFGLYGVDADGPNPIVWKEREYYYDSKAHQRQKTDAEYADDMLHFISDIQRLHGSDRRNPGVERVYVDPSAASFKLELRRRGLPVHDADNDVLNGIRTHSRMLANGEYAVCDSCTKTIEEYSGYVWDPNAAKRGEDKPVKQHDHTKDEERYVLHTHFGGRRLDYSKLTMR